MIRTNGRDLLSQILQLDGASGGGGWTIGYGKNWEEFDPDDLGRKKDLSSS